MNSEKSHYSLDSGSEDEILDEKDSCPWLTLQTRQIKDINIRLHNEIIDFVTFVYPSDEDHKRRKEVIQEVIKALSQDSNQAKIHPFGSYLCRLYLKNSDIDLVMMDESKSEEQLMKSVLQLMDSEKNLFRQVERIQANTPLIKFVARDFKFDLSFNNEEGRKQGKEVQDIEESFPPFKHLFFIIKVFLYQRNWNNTFKGGIGSFLLQNMVHAFLKCFYKQFLQKNDESQLSQVTLSHYLIKFLKFYASFDF